MAENIYNDEEPETPASELEPSVVNHGWEVTDLSLQLYSTQISKAGELGYTNSLVICIILLSIILWSSPHLEFFPDLNFGIVAVK